MTNVIRTSNAVTSAACPDCAKTYSTKGSSRINASAIVCKAALLRFTKFSPFDSFCAITHLNEFRSPSDLRSSDPYHNPDYSRDDDPVQDRTPEDLTLLTRKPGRAAAHDNLGWG
jgi:hypothetical protein